MTFSSVVSRSVGCAAGEAAMHRREADEAVVSNGSYCQMLCSGFVI